MADLVDCCQVVNDGGTGTKPSGVVRSRPKEKSWARSAEGSRGTCLADLNSARSAGERIAESSWDSTDSCGSGIAHPLYLTVVSKCVESPTEASLTSTE
jgi:hypothetical protein